MKIYNIIKNNKIKLIISLAIILILVIVVSYFSTKYNELDNIRFMKEYEKLNNEVTSDGKKYPFVDISSDNVMKYSNIKEILKIIDDREDAVVYFGYASCLYCRTAVQVLYDVSKNMDLDKIYYVDVQERNSYDDELLELLGDKFIVIDNDEEKLRIPLVLFIVDGNIVSYNRGTIVSQTDPYTKLNDSQLYALNKIYSSGIKDVLDGMQN